MRQRPSGADMRLVFHHPSGSETVDLCPGDSVTVGRHKDADLPIEDSTLSRRHARFDWDGSNLTVHDLDSTNGTMVNGNAIRTATVTDSDLVKMGSIRAVLQPTECSPRRSSDRDNTLRMVFRSATMTQLMRTVDRVAHSGIPVLIHGETGTGKELIARSLHKQSPRSSGPIITVNCAAIPASLMESTLFGHERGAFTGATGQANGVFEEAIGGTVFLDEIAELAPASQAALLRTLETKTVVRVGSRREIPVDIRVIAASHRDLDAMVATGEFRQDLLYRLNTIVLEVPALRDRKEDIEPLVQHFLSQTTKKQMRSLQLSASARDLLCRYDWPGNVRELRNEIERAGVVTEGSLIEVTDLSTRVQRFNFDDPTVLPPPFSEALGHKTRAVFGERPIEEETVPAVHALAASGVRCLPDEELGYREQVREFEKSLLLNAFQKANGNQSEAARLLQMPVRTFNHKFRALGLNEMVQSAT